MGGLLSPENRRTFSRGLLDATQAASNSAASTVSAPVDALAWALRKAGVPIPQAPFGGSDWMKAQGLMRDVQSPVANVIGESIGNVLPIVAAAKAPQIANALLKAGENASAKAPMNAATRNQAGAIVWHGSPHKFDRFDASKIGTGEGAQAYGHGLYLAEAPDVANQYATMFNKSAPKPLSLQRLRDSAPVGSAEWKHYDGLLNEGIGNLYKVDLPDDQIAKMLDWDKPLYRQKPEVRKAVRELVDEKTQPGTYAQWVKAARPDMRTLQNDMLDSMDNSAISEALRAKGIPGIRYLDGGSRSAGSGTSNFVVFPGNEGLLNILERNGQPIR